MNGKIIDTTYIEEKIDAAFVGGGRYIEVRNLGNYFARLENGVYSYRNQDTYGEVKQRKSVNLNKLKRIFFGLISKYHFFETNESCYYFQNGKWLKY